MQIAMTHPAAGDIALVASPMRLSATPVAYRSAPPHARPAHREVLAELLGLDADACDALAARA